MTSRWQPSPTAGQGIPGLALLGSLLQLQEGTLHVEGPRMKSRLHKVSGPAPMNKFSKIPL